MKVAITGHISGIGWGIANYYKAIGYEIVGFDRENGYELPKDIDRVYNGILPCDIFINNVYHLGVQVQLMQRVFFAWKGMAKTIVTLGSLASDGRHQRAPMYAAMKRAIDEEARQLATISNSPRLLVLRPGLVDTPFAGVEGPKMKVSDVVSVLAAIRELPFQVQVLNITFKHVDQVLV